MTNAVFFFLNCRRRVHEHSAMQRVQKYTSLFDSRGEPLRSSCVSGADLENLAMNDVLEWLFCAFFFLFSNRALSVLFLIFFFLPPSCFPKKGKKPTRF